MNIDAYPYSIALSHRFRGLTSRDGVLLHGPGGWAEVSPFWDYGSHYSSRWLLGAVMQASGFEHYSLTHLKRTSIDCNCTIPAVDAQTAHDLARSSGARTAKVKIADHPDSLFEDCERLEAVRSALGTRGNIRIDINGRWDLATAERSLPVLDRAAGGLEYAEQPVMDTYTLSVLHRKIDVPLAADESIRRSPDPLQVKRLDAADVAVIKVQPLGGIRRALHMADALNLPCTISSALETSVGLHASLICAAMVQDLPYACGLGTLSLFSADVTSKPYLPRTGIIEIHSVGGQTHNSHSTPCAFEPIIPDRLDQATAPTSVAVCWEKRFAAMWDYLASLHSRVWENPDSTRDTQLFFSSSPRTYNVGNEKSSVMNTEKINLPNGDQLSYTFHKTPPKGIAITGMCTENTGRIS